MVSAAVKRSANRAPRHARSRIFLTMELPAALNDCDSSVTIARRGSPEMESSEAKWSHAQIWTRHRGSLIPELQRVVMDRFPSISVLSCYRTPLLPACCQHRQAHVFERENP